MALKEMTQKLSLMEKLGELKKTYQTIASDNSLVYEDAQSLIPIIDIMDGMIFTSEGQVISMVEIIPVNFKSMSIDEQNHASTVFGDAFKQLPENGHFKMMNINTNLDSYEKMIRDISSKENNRLLDKRVDNYIKFMRYSINNNGKIKRFFYIYEYEGNARNVKTDDYAEVYKTMRQTQKDVILALRASGNIVIDLFDPKAIAEVYYQFFNPTSSQKESLNQRIAKIQETASWFGQTPSLKDAIAPRGIRFGKWNYVVMDGLYHTFFSITDEGYPEQVTANWLSNIYNQLTDCDMDIYYQKNESMITEKMLERTEVISEALSTVYDQSEKDKQAQLNEAASNASFVRNSRKNGEDFYEICIIFTMRSSSYEEMASNVETTKKTMRRLGIGLENCFLQTDNYFKMSMPLMNKVPIIFNSNRRNITNSGMGSLYHFISSLKFDEKGCWLGYTNDGSPFSLDLYSKKYTNGHVAIIGTTGSGKTFSTLALTSRMNMLGARIMFILPLKGEEYKEPVESIGGEFVSLYPGSKQRINICEIREMSYVKTADKEEEDSCLLANKISSLIAWFSLLMNKNDYLSTSEVGILNVIFKRVYEKKGITEDNLSIYEGNNPNNPIKEMPIIGDLYEEIKKDGRVERLAGVLEPWVYGNCSNMNGQTNVDLNLKATAVYVDENKTTEALLAAFMYIPFDVYFQIGKRDVNEKCALVIDEAWNFLKIESCTSQILKMIKILRSYNTSCIIATQNVSDYNESSKRILSLPATKLIMKVEQAELDDVDSIMKLTAEERASLPKFQSGEAIYYANNEKTRIFFQLSQHEMLIYEPREEDKQRIRKSIAKGMI